MLMRQNVMDAGRHSARPAFPRSFVRHRRCEWLLLLLLLGGGWLTGCRFTPAAPATTVPLPDVIVHDTWSDRVTARPERAPQQGLGLAFIWPENLSLPVAQLPQTQEVRLEPGEPFAPFLILKSETPTTVLVTAVLNYEQVAIELDGRAGILHAVELPSGVDLEIPLAIAVPQTGLNDLIVLAFADPYAATLDLDYRLSNRADVVGRRATVIVGDNESPVAPFTTVAGGYPIPADIEVGFHAAFAEPGPMHPSTAQLYVADGYAPGDRFDFRIWTANRHGQGRATYAIMLFYNFRLQPIDGARALVVDLPSNHEYVVPAVVELAPATGVNQLEMIVVFDPHVSLLSPDLLAPFVLDSHRIAVEATGRAP